MAYDATLFAPAGQTAAVFAPVAERPIRTDDEFQRSERLVVIAGASVFGALLGGGAALAFGYVPNWMILVAGAPLFLMALYFGVAAMRDAIDRRAYGCAGATLMYLGALFAWPVAAFMYPQTALQFWCAPAMAFTSLLLFASCWGGSKRVVYRACAQGGLMAACAGYVAITTLMGA